MSGHRGWPLFSVVAVSIILGLQAASSLDHGLQRWLFGHFAVTWRTTAAFEWHRFIVSPFIQDHPGFVRIVPYLVVALPACEWLYGLRRTIAVFLLGDLLSTVPVLIAFRLAAEFGSAAAERAMDRPDSGSSSALIACTAATAVALPRNVRAVLLVAGASFLAARLILSARLYDYQHVIAAAVGLGLALAWTWPRGRSDPSA